MKKAALTLSFLISFLATKALTVEEVWQEILKNEIKFPEIVLRQAIWESGWFKCKNCGYSINNNLFGFNNGKKKYKNWQESVADYKKWQDKYFKNKEENTEQDYYNFLTNIGYSENGKSYEKALKSLKLPDTIKN